MWPERLLDNRVTHGLQLAARFAESRHALLAEHVANVDTPDYRPRKLDAQDFQSSLRDAFATAERVGVQRLKLRGDRQVSTAPDGRLQTRPSESSPDNVLFHDGSNDNVETLLADVQQNALTYRLAVNLLRGRFERAMSAIRGRI